MLALSAAVEPDYTYLSTRTANDKPESRQVVCWWNDRTYPRHLHLQVLKYKYKDKDKQLPRHRSFCLGHATLNSPVRQTTKLAPAACPHFEMN